MTQFNPASARNCEAFERTAKVNVVDPSEIETKRKFAKVKLLHNREQDSVT